MGTRNFSEDSATSQTAEAEEDSSVEFGFEIMPNGDIRFCRCDPATNAELYDFLSQFTSSPEELKEFFDAAKSITPLLGDEPLCG